MYLVRTSFQNILLIVDIQCRWYTKSLIVKLLIIDIQRAVVSKLTAFSEIIDKNVIVKKTNHMEPLNQHQMRCGRHLGTCHMSGISMSYDISVHIPVIYLACDTDLFSNKTHVSIQSSGYMASINAPNTHN